MKEKNNKLKKKDGHENIDVLLIENDLSFQSFQKYIQN
jgi:hypothetical protein